MRAPRHLQTPFWEAKPPPARIEAARSLEEQLGEQSERLEKEQQATLVTSAAMVRQAETEGDMKRQNDLREAREALAEEHAADKQAALFVAGGVGISPLYGMLRAWCLRAGTHARAALLFAARSRAERLFATQLEGLARAHPERLRVSIHTTREPPQPGEPGAYQVRCTCWLVRA